MDLFVGFYWVCDPSKMEMFRRETNPGNNQPFRIRCPQTQEETLLFLLPCFFLAAARAWRFDDRIGSDGDLNDFVHVCDG